MNSVNPILVPFFYRSAIANLPERKREIYQYIESKEAELEKIAANEKQFMELMVEKSPFKEAADHFSLTMSTIKEIMDEAQAEIDLMIMARINRMRWINYSKTERKFQKRKNKKWTFFLFLNYFFLEQYSFKRNRYDKLYVINRNYYVLLC
ncbi:hypothetical protein [Niallia sp. RD1]|uniref:hypothetical protein n=1 Tax=Niallia sp. RD1 TaxID=2962858 RepID=UPI0020C19D70|nr:hypothetical protein [Niallia sp. RD1]UTI41323.1 hypothetical protein NKG37_21105 [Niallia sp. RD1]